MDTRKVDGRSRGHREGRQKFTDGPMDGRKFDVRCLSARKVHGSLQKVLRPHRKLMEYLSAALKVDATSQKVP